MDKAVIAIVFDFDETLGPDTISFVLREQNMSPVLFWKKVNDMVADGWDPPLAYMHLLLKASKEGKLDLSKKSLERLGRDLPFSQVFQKHLKN